MAGVDPGLVRVVLDSGDDDPFLLLLAGVVVGLFLIYDGFDTWQMAHLIANTPTEKVRSMAVGRTELEGVVREHDGTVDPPFVDEACVYVDWATKRREKYRDDDGNVQYRWKTVASGTDAYPFDLDDGTGRATVRTDRDRPEFEIVSDDHDVTITYGRGEQPDPEVLQYISRYRGRQREANRDAGSGDGGDDDGGLLDSVTDVVSALANSGDPFGNTSRRRKYEQEVLTVGSDAYVFGSAEPTGNESVDAGQEDLLEIRRDGGTDEFLVADSSEETIQSRYSRRGPLKTVGGLALSAVALFFLLQYPFVGLPQVVVGVPIIVVVMYLVHRWKSVSLKSVVWGAIR